MKRHSASYKEIQKSTDTRAGERGLGLRVIGGADNRIIRGVRESSSLLRRRYERPYEVDDMNASSGGSTPQNQIIAAARNPVSVPRAVRQG
jgi:hypothetical protein